jgi:Tfp pilus assembly PilM family ATPase
MAVWSEWVDRVRGLDVERALGLRPAWPGLALELEGTKLVAVRLRRRRRGVAQLEAFHVGELGRPAVPATIFETETGPGEEFGARVAEALAAVGARPGRVSLVLPDNLAKVSLLHLPEKPPGRKQLLEIIRFKLHRAVPFRFSEAAVTWQVLPSDGPGVVLLVALVRRSLVECYERALRGIGARPGLIDLCTANLLNLCRSRIDGASDGDVALLNCTPHYFTLLIVRSGSLIFYRCKSYAVGEGASGPPGMNGMLAREVANSFSYYEEKLQGRGVSTLLVRSVAAPFEALAGSLASLGVEHVVPIDPMADVTLEAGRVLDPVVGQQIAPAVGAAVGRA